ncbi:glycine/betaine ABC transporter substrate-binding protein [Bacillaceae bacterium SIJ1]|uniref:ABC transporter substrate-binding protein n=1 Tax=Litoribacterium kuwaitense TaxID=1398745 RepID=UPI0013EB34AC|nr:glycine betaine ABC transporter substrate-binding protein [Litoribacterium kuwaitense]NGP44001.1 glycine/betaine ABC transporter substrate-binding protein [Litoribacterium kuwaitense]
MKKRLLWIPAIVMLFVVSACGGASTDKVSIGAKNFTEQYLFAEMAKQIFEAEGMKVEVKDGLGSNAMRQALESGQVNFTFDYTGTGLVNYNKQDPISDATESFEKVKEIDAEQGIVWTNMTEVNNTYAIVMPRQLAEELGIQSLSDYAEYINNNPGEITIAFDSEFAERQEDGWPAVERVYEFELPSEQVSQMAIGLNYEALNNGEVNSAVGFTTASQVAEYDFLVLEDDKKVFPDYTAAIAMSAELYEAKPEVAELLKPLTDILTNEEMVSLSHKVDFGEQDVSKVASTYLQEKGIVE